MTMKYLEHYCIAQDEIPKDQYQNFKEWMAENEYWAFRVEEFDGAVYHPFHVVEYKQTHGIRPVEVIEDIGTLESKLEFTD